MVLTNAPGLSDEFQKRAFREVRSFFDSPMELKKTAHISNTPYFRGYSLPTPADSGFGQVIEAFQYGFEQESLCDYDDKSQPIHRRLFRGPNTWPEDESLPGFRPLIDELNDCYHRLTHELGEAIVESLGKVLTHSVNILILTIRIWLRVLIIILVFTLLPKRIGKMSEKSIKNSQVIK